MAPTPIQCSVTDCDYKTPAEGIIQQKIDLPAGNLLQGLGGQANHHHWDVQSRHQAAGPEQNKDW